MSRRISLKIEVILTPVDDPFQFSSIHITLFVFKMAISFFLKKTGERPDSKLDLECLTVCGRGSSGLEAETMRQSGQDSLENQIEDKFQEGS